LACSQYMFQQSSKTPLLLLDDVFDNQVFITDTEISRMQIILNALEVEKKFFKVSDGRVEEF